MINGRAFLSQRYTSPPTCTPPSCRTILVIFDRIHEVSIGCVFLRQLRMSEAPGLDDRVSTAQDVDSHGTVLDPPSPAQLGVETGFKTAETCRDRSKITTWLGFFFFTPRIPGDVSICGNLPQSVVQMLAGSSEDGGSKCYYKAWLYIERTDSSEFYFPEALGGVTAEAVHWATPIPTEQQADAVLAAMDRLPRPLMVQCRTGGRASAALAKKQSEE